MRRGFMGMMLKLRHNRRSGLGKGLLVHKRHAWVGQRSRWCWLCFFDWKGIVHHEFVPRGRMVNRQLYQEVLAHLRDAVRRKRPELWVNQTWTLHHDIATAHASLLICIYLAKHQTSVVPHPTLFSGRSLSRLFFLFPNLKALWEDVISKP